MADSRVQGAIELFQEQIARLQQELTAKKKMVNELCVADSRPPVYQDVGVASAVTGALRKDEFYGQPLATATRSVLERNKASGGGAMTVAEIYEVLQKGGFGFQGKNDDNNRRGLYVSLGKNTSVFHKLANGSYGLLEWYPTIRESKASKKDNGQKNGQTEQADLPLHEELQEQAAEADEAMTKPK